MHIILINRSDINIKRTDSGRKVNVFGRCRRYCLESFVPGGRIAGRCEVIVSMNSILFVIYFNMFLSNM